MTAKTFLQKLQSGGLLAAHRGHRSLYPENTLVAFEDCRGKCDFIELDVRFSKDGVPVVFHDHNLTRTSNIEHCGLFPGRENKYLESFNFNELQKLDIGSWFYESDPWGQIASGRSFVPERTLQSQTIADLNSVLTLIREQQLSVNIEIKSLHTNKTESAETLLRTIHDQDLDDQCVVSAFDHGILRLMKDMDSSMIAAALVENSHPEEDILNYLQRSGFQGYHMDDAMVNADDVAELRNAGVFVCVYTVNDKSRKQELLQMGVSAVITDFL